MIPWSTTKPEICYSNKRTKKTYVYTALVMLRGYSPTCILFKYLEVSGTTTCKMQPSIWHNSALLIKNWRNYCKFPTGPANWRNWSMTLRLTFWLHYSASYHLFIAFLLLRQYRHKYYTNQSPVITRLIYYLNYINYWVRWNLQERSL